MSHVVAGLAVEPSHRGQGLGYDLMRAGEKAAWQAGKSLVCGFVIPANRPSRNLLGKLGWQETTTHAAPLRGRLLGEPEYIRMERRLDGHEWDA